MLSQFQKHLSINVIGTCVLIALGAIAKQIQIEVDL